MEALQGLRDAGVELEVGQGPGYASGQDAVVSIRYGPRKVEFLVEAKARAPYPNELDQLGRRRAPHSRKGHRLLVAPFVSEPLGLALTEAGWSWADNQGNFDIRAPGLLLRQRRSTHPPKRQASSLPRGSGSFAIVRALIRFGQHEEEEPSVTTLAAQAGVTQPRASQVISRLHDLGLVEKTERGRWRPDRAALLDRFIEEYRGPGGSERPLYSLDSPRDVAVRAAQLGTRTNRVVVSADVGPDLLAPWRRPSVAVIYAQREIPSNELRCVNAEGPHDSNVVLRIPADRSVFPAPPELVAEIHDTEVPLADPSQMIWDLHDLGGVDRLEAAGAVREWLLTRP